MLAAMNSSASPALLSKSQLAVLAKVGVQLCLEAAHYARRGEGCSTVGFYLGLHWKTASTAMNVGLLLPMAGR